MTATIPAAEPLDPVQVGSLTVLPVYDGVAVLTTEMFTHANGSPTDWSDHTHLLDDDGRLAVPVGGFVVRTGDDVVLVDAGAGLLTDEMFTCGLMLESLRAIGLTPNDITVVAVTHLHSDHMGWLEHEGQPVFPNATVRIGAADWTFFVDQTGSGRRKAERLRAIADHVEPIDRDGDPIAPGVTSRATPGHTPGHTSYVISSGPERLIVMGDVLHCPAQLTETEWQFLFDADATLAARTRAALVAEAEQPGTTLLPMHFPGLRGSRLLPATAPRRWAFT